tara:strand:- start:1000 stop:1200 length:201 start_codon:yes stop_codon:yes gene_type:complete
MGRRVTSMAIRIRPPAIPTMPEIIAVQSTLVRIIRVFIVALTLTYDINGRIRRSTENKDIAYQRIL